MDRFVNIHDRIHEFFESYKENDPRIAIVEARKKFPEICIQNLEIFVDRTRIQYTVAGVPYTRNIFKDA